MERKNIISISGTAIIKVTYNYEIKDIEKFKQIIKEKRDELENFKDLWNEGIISYDNEYVKYVDIDYDDIVREDSYIEINGWTDEVENIITENKLDELDEWY